MRVLRITPSNGHEVIDVPNELVALHKAVGGFMKVVYLTSRMVMIINEEGKLRSLPDNDAATVIYQYYHYNSCDVIVDEVVKDLVKISNWCCTQGDESESDYSHMLGFIQGFTEALADKYRNKIRRLNNNVD